MVDIEFDLGKNEINREKHGLDFSRAAAISTYFRIDHEQESDGGEERFLTLGRISRNEIVVCAWTQRGARARIISLRRADKDEREIYNFHRP